MKKQVILFPDNSIIFDQNDTYPYVTEVMSSVRSDIDKSSTAYQLFYNLSMGKYNKIIDESGYVVRTKK